MHLIGGWLGCKRFLGFQKEVGQSGPSVVPEVMGVALLRITLEEWSTWSRQHVSDNTVDVENLQCTNASSSPDDVEDHLQLFLCPLVWRVFVQHKF